MGVTHLPSLAAAQTIPIPGDVSANIERHARMVHAAAEERVGVLVFPELSLTGYELDLASRLVFSEKDPRLDPLVDLASNHGMTLIVGAPVRMGSRTHICAFILSPDGSVDIYTKRHLGAEEDSVVQSGEHSPLLRIGRRIGAVAVCADANEPSHAEEAANRGAAVYLVSSFIIPSALARKTARLRACAVDHSMTVVFSNYGGPTGGLPPGGRSAIWSDQGELLAQMDAVGAGLTVAHATTSGWRAKAVPLPGT